MKTPGILIQKNNRKILANKVRLCRNFFSRARGLLGTKELASEEACWLIPCNSVHTFGMNYPIDVYFLNKKNEIISMIQNMKPNRVSPVVWKAHSVLELRSGIVRDIKPGDMLEWEKRE